MKVGPKLLGSENVVFSIDAGNQKSYSGSGNGWRNKAGRGSNGTLENGTTYNTTALGCMDFDGTDDFASIEADTTVFNYQSPFTISCWFYIDTLVSATNARLWDKSDEATTGRRADRERTDAGFALLIKTNGSTNTLVPALDGAQTSMAVAVDTLKWNHIAVIYNTSSVSLMLNGGSPTTVSHSGNLSNITTTNNLTIGNVLRGNRPLDGKVSNLQIYNKVLTTIENKNNYIVTKNRYQ